MKISMQKGYPDSSGKSHKLLADAQKAESNIQLQKAVDGAGDLDNGNVIDFIKQNNSTVLEYIKYNCVKKPAKKKPAAKAAAKTAKDKKAD